MSAVISELPVPDAPYRGVKEFRFVDQQLFAAREEEIWDLVSKVTLYRGVLLFGESGSGKSSLVNAGLLPRMLNEDYVPDRLRVQPYAGREIKVERIRASEGPPQTYLPSNFTPDWHPSEPSSNGDAESFELSLPSFINQLERLRPSESDVEPEFEPEALFNESRGGPRPLLIFDQFEEFITLFDEAQRGGLTTLAQRAQQAPQVQQSILATLVKLIQDETLPLRILFVFREDYLAKLNLLFKLCPNLLDQGQRLVTPKISELPRVIREPFTNPVLRSYFLRPGAEQTSELSEGLAQQITKRLARRSEGENVNLTELQIVCLQLWQSPEPERHFSRTGIEGLLKEYGASVFSDLKPELHPAAAILLSHLITGQNTRNIISENDLLALSSQHRPPATEEDLQAALETLCRTQLVRREQRRNISVYELVSEYSVPWIIELVANRKALELSLAAGESRSRLANQRLKVWQEFRRTRLLKRLLAGFVALLIGVVALGLVAGYQYKKLLESRQEKEDSDRQRVAAEATVAETKQQQKQYEAAIKVITGENEETKLKALAEISNWIKENDFPSNLALLLTLPRNDTPRVKEELSRVSALAVQNDRGLLTSAETNTGLAEKLPPRFYIRYANDAQLPLVQKVSAALKQRGWVVPNPTKMDGVVYWDNQLVYYRESEPNAPPIEDILKLLDDTTGFKWGQRHVEIDENSRKIRPGHFELVFASPTGQWNVSLLDEQDNPLKNVTYTLRFKPQGSGVAFIRSRRGPGYIDVPPGSYDVTVTATGYKQVSMSLTIAIGQSVQWTYLRMTKE